MNSMNIEQLRNTASLSTHSIPYAVMIRYLDQINTNYTVAQFHCCMMRLKRNFRNQFNKIYKLNLNGSEESSNFIFDRQNECITIEIQSINIQTISTLVVSPENNTFRRIKYLKEFL